MQQRGGEVRVRGVIGDGDERGEGGTQGSQSVRVISGAVRAAGQATRRRRLLFRQCHLGLWFRYVEEKPGVWKFPNRSEKNPRPV